jgi:hypothetical protein
MKATHLKLALLFAAILPIGCSNSVEDVSFTGTWKVVNENGISDLKSEATVVATVDKNRFRIVFHDEEKETTENYDGDTFTQKSAGLNQTESPTSSSEKKSTAEMEPHRFWKRRFTGDAIAGGVIAGRETNLFQSQNDRPDGQVTLQAWVDAETGVLLKKIFTVYSTQMQQMISKTTEECREIRYGPVPATAFEKP